MEKDYIKVEIKDPEINFEVRAILKRWYARYDYSLEAWDASACYQCIKNELDGKFPSGQWDHSSRHYIYSL